MTELADAKYMEQNVKDSLRATSSEPSPDRGLPHQDLKRASPDYVHFPSEFAANADDACQEREAKARECRRNSRMQMLAGVGNTSVLEGIGRPDMLSVVKSQVDGFVAALNAMTHRAVGRCSD